MTKYFAFILACLIALVSAAHPSSASTVTNRDREVPRYTHIFLIVEENEGYQPIIGSPHAPNLTKLAQTYGNATNFYAERHPSEPNYVAMIGGSTFGIHDDAPYRANSVDAPNLAQQLEQAHLGWAGYFGGFDPSQPWVTLSPARSTNGMVQPTGLYVSKHNPFVNFTALRNEPGFVGHLHPLDTLETALNSGDMPALIYIVPNICDDMHGMGKKLGVPRDCGKKRPDLRIARGDRFAEHLVEEIMSSPTWSSAQNSAIVITFDENDDKSRSIGKQGCCGAIPGGGRIPTIVIGNHTPAGIEDPTPYNHYSLLRTMEDAFGLYSYVGTAADWADGVRPMLPLFRR